MGRGGSKCCRASPPIAACLIRNLVLEIFVSFSADYYQGSGIRVPVPKAQTYALYQSHTNGGKYLLDCRETSMLYFMPSIKVLLDINFNRNRILLLGRGTLAVLSTRTTSIRTLRSLSLCKTPPALVIWGLLKVSR